MNFKQRLEQYKKQYDIEDATNQNDIANLETLINNQQMLDRIQQEIDTLMNDDEDDRPFIDKIGAIKKLNDARNDLVTQSMALEKMLGIDRKSRKKDVQEDIGAYIAFIKKSASDWLDRQLIYAYCPNCKVMVGRILPAQEYTEFHCKFQCSQCNKFVEVKRKERDVFFDIKERNKDWRKKHPVEIIQGQKEVIESDDDIYLEEENDTIESR